MVERLPVGTRVIYPPAPRSPLAHPGAAVRYALNHPEGTEPLHAQLRPGMRVTIAIDDLSVSFPSMRSPDVRQTIVEAVLGLLADHGVDDVHIIVATGLNRRMTGAELQRMVGRKIFATHWPDRLYNHDAEDPAGFVELGRSRHGGVVRLDRRCVESDLVVCVAVHCAPAALGQQPFGVGLCDYETHKAHFTSANIRASSGYTDSSSSGLQRSVDGLGRLVEQHLKVFHIAAALNNRTYDGAMGFLGKNEDHYTELDRVKLKALQWTLDRTPQPLRRELFMRVPAAYQMIAVHAGAAQPVQQKVLAACASQCAVGVHGQADVLISGVPCVSPYNVGSAALNPVLVQFMGLGYGFHMARPVPVVKKGGVLILTHPCSDRFDPDHHPSYIEFFHRLLPSTRDAATLESTYQDEVARNPSFTEMYRRGHAYHGAHPFYAWYWGEAARQHLAKVIVVGADNAHVPERLGWTRAETLRDAIAEAKSFLGRSPEITVMHQPPAVVADMSV
jgi:hypothetical protein